VAVVVNRRKVNSSAQKFLLLLRLPMWLPGGQPSSGAHCTLYSLDVKSKCTGAFFLFILMANSTHKHRQPRENVRAAVGEGMGQLCNTAILFVEYFKNFWRKMGV
jgi:hypothetical protein